MAENNLPSVCIIGGGIAGLSSAVFLSNHNLNITLLEASPKLGGRTSSFFDSQINDYLDNGQHILASWYYTTLEMLKLTGTIDKLKFQKQMEVHLADTKGKRYLFKCPVLVPPVNLLSGIWNYKALTFNDKLGIVRLVNFLILHKYEDDELKEINLIELFKITNQPEKLIKMFWEPLILAVFNAKPKDVSAWYFSNIVRAGFFKKDGSQLILPRGTLSSIFVDGCFKYLEEKNVNIRCQARVEKINFEANKIVSLTLSDKTVIKADYYVCALPFYELPNMFEDTEQINYFRVTSRLSPSPIINIHLFYRTANGNEVFNNDFIGLLGTTIQWVFKVKPGHVCLIISSADEVIDIDKDKLVDIGMLELRSCLPGFKDVEFTYSRVVKEKRATFLPNVDSIKARLPNKTPYNNLFLACDWTDTGLPSTIESAALSGKKCADEILRLLVV